MTPLDRASKMAVAAHTADNDDVHVVMFKRASSRTTIAVKGSLMDSVPLVPMTSVLLEIMGESHAKDSSPI